MGDSGSVRITQVLRLLSRMGAVEIRRRMWDELVALFSTAQFLMLVNGVLVVEVLFYLEWTLSEWLRAGTGWGPACLLSIMAPNIPSMGRPG